LGNFDDALADDLDVLTGELLQYGEQELLFAQERRILHLVLLGESQKLGSGLGLQILKFDFPHVGAILE